MRDEPYKSALQLHRIATEKIKMLLKTQDPEVLDNLRIGFNLQLAFGDAEMEDDEFIENYKVTLGADIKGKNDLFRLEVAVSGYFTLVRSQIDENYREMIINKNAVAIVFPYLRSQISSITNSLGLEKTIYIPTINVNTLFEENETT